MEQRLCEPDTVLKQRRSDCGSSNSPVSIEKMEKHSYAVVSNPRGFPQKQLEQVHNHQGPDTTHRDLVSTKRGGFGTLAQTSSITARTALDSKPCQDCNQKHTDTLVCKQIKMQVMPLSMRSMMRKSFNRTNGKIDEMLCLP